MAKYSDGVLIVAQCLLNFSNISKIASNWSFLHLHVLGFLSSNCNKCKRKKNQLHFIVALKFHLLIHDKIHYLCPANFDAKLHVNTTIL